MLKNAAALLSNGEPSPIFSTLIFSSDKYFENQLYIITENNPTNTGAGGTYHHTGSGDEDLSSFNPTYHIFPYNADKEYADVSVEITNYLSANSTGGSPATDNEGYIIFTYDDTYSYDNNLTWLEGFYTGTDFDNYTSLDDWLINVHGEEGDNTIESQLPMVLEKFGGVEIQYTHVINSYYSFDNANIKDLYFISNLNERSISLNGIETDDDGRELPTLQEFYSIDFSSDNSNQHNTGIGKDQIFFYNDGDMDIEDGVNIVAIYQGGDVWYIQALGGSPIDDIEIKSGQAFSFQAVKTDEREMEGYGNFNFIQEEI